MRYLRLSKTLTAALALAALAAHGPVASTTLTISTPIVISTVVLSTCTIVPSAIVFPDYALGEQSNITGNIAVTCTPDVTSYQVALDAGTGSGASVSGGRKMTSLTVPGATLTYNLYRDANRTQPWGSTRDVDTVVSTGTLLQNYTVYAKLPMNQYVAAGAYQDTVSVSLLY
jgi:spore coat protein U-like protein